MDYIRPLSSPDQWLQAADRKTVSRVALAVAIAADALSVFASELIKLHLITAFTALSWTAIKALQAPFNPVVVLRAMQHANGRIVKTERFRMRLEGRRGFSVQKGNIAEQFGEGVAVVNSANPQMEYGKGGTNKALSGMMTENEWAKTRRGKTWLETGEAVGAQVTLKGNSPERAFLIQALGPDWRKLSPTEEMQKQIATLYREKKEGYEEAVQALYDQAGREFHSRTIAKMIYERARDQVYLAYDNAFKQALVLGATKVVVPLISADSFARGAPADWQNVIREQFARAAYDYPFKEIVLIDFKETPELFV